MPRRTAWPKVPTSRRCCAGSRRPTPWARAYPSSGLKPERLLGLIDGLRAMGIDAVYDALREARRDHRRPGEVRHALAILAWRELNADDLDAKAARRAWAHWLAAGAPPAVVAHLMAWHRSAITASLARGYLESARRHWDVLHAIDELKEPMAAFRDALATEYLVHTRETMANADAPPGYRADYERGLSLRGSLSNGCLAPSTQGSTPTHVPGGCSTVAASSTPCRSAPARSSAIRNRPTGGRWTSISPIRRLSAASSSPSREMRGPPAGPRRAERRAGALRRLREVDVRSPGRRVPGGPDARLHDDDGQGR